MPRFEIGTSGYIGSKKDWLTMPLINCLEINSSFYKLPSAKSIENYNKLSSEGSHKGLIYSVKVSRFITHMKRLKNCKQAFAKFWRAVKGLQSNLKALLFQLPPSFKYNDVTMERLKKLTYVPTTNDSGEKINIIFEFRDDSWFKKDVVSLFKTRGWVLGGTFIKKKKGQYWMGNMPAGLHLPEKTTNCTYLRIHGGRGYRGGYDNKQLRNIKRAVLAKRTAINFVIFNNVFFDSRKKTCKYKKRKIRYAALCNASQFGKLTRKKKRVKKIKIGGGGCKMKERIVEFKRGPFPKKYTAIVKNMKTKKTRKLHFGDRRYQQYKDRTPLKLYKRKNHNTRKRMRNYFNRHSGTKKRGVAIHKEKCKSKGHFTPKILSHIYLW